jgi:DNA-binding MarR family transcriptional regulator
MIPGPYYGRVSSEPAPPDVRWLSSEELQAWVTVMALMETLPNAIEAQLKNDGGINRFEYMVLAMLSAEPDRTAVMSDVAAFAVGSLSRLSHAVGRLEERGWVERSPGTGGRRHKILRLTDDGVAELRRIAPGHAAEVRRLVIDPLDAAELKTLTDLARRLLVNVAPEVDSLFDARIADLVASNEQGDT